MDPSPLSPSRRFFRRLAMSARVVVALSLIVLSLWSLLLPVSIPISTTAAVTARVAMVPAPIQGDVMALAADTGDLVGIGQLLVELGNGHSPLDNQLSELRAQRVNLETQRASLATELRETEAVKATYDARYREYGQRIVQETERLVVESQKTHESLLAVKDLRAAALAHLRARAGETPDAAAEAELAKAKQEVELADKTAAVEAARTERLRAHVADAKAGYYVALGFEPPAFAGLLAELDLRVAKLRSEKIRLESLGTNMDGQIRLTEQRRLEMVQRRVESPVKGIVWTRPVNVGQFVDTGTELYRIADHRSVQVHAYFHRRYLDGMAIGHKATVYLVAAKKVVTGTVKVIQAIDAAEREEFAIRLPSPDENHFKVVIELDEAGRKLAEVGGVAKVAVVGRLEGRFEQAMMWLYLRFES